MQAQMLCGQRFGLRLIGNLGVDLQLLVGGTVLVVVVHLGNALDGGTIGQNIADPAALILGVRLLGAQLPVQDIFLVDKNDGLLLLVGRLIVDDQHPVGGFEIQSCILTELEQELNISRPGLLHPLVVGVVLRIKHRRQPMIGCDFREDAGQLIGLPGLRLFGLPDLGRIRQTGRLDGDRVRRAAGAHAVQLKLAAVKALVLPVRRPVLGRDGAAYLQVVPRRRFDSGRQPAVQPGLVSVLKLELQVVTLGVVVVDVGHRQQVGHNVGGNVGPVKDTLEPGAPGLIHVAHDFTFFQGGRLAETGTSISGKASTIPAGKIK